ncbi:MAG: hypothetical protein K2J30_01215, partial [Clostridia bacterium]|nr:hypothetical protein [Clostridia bacterium]
NSKKRFIPAFLFLPVSAIGCGLAMSSLYVYLGEAPNLLISFCIWSAYVLLFLIYCFLGNTPLFKRHPYMCIIDYAIIVALAGVIGICVSSKVIFSLVLMMFILFIAHLATILLHSADYVEHIHNLVIVSFVGLFIVVIVVLIVISGGDGLDGLDGGGFDPSGGNSDKKKNPYDFGTTNEQKKRWLDS